MDLQFTIKMGLFEREDFRVLNRNLLQYNGINYLTTHYLGVK